MLDAFIEQEMPDRAKQRVYENGYDSLRLTKGQANSNQAVYSLATVGQYGPRFDIAKLKKDITGDKVGQARAYLQDLPGVKGIDINLSPFWARQIPNEGKITIKLDVDENASS